VDAKQKLAMVHPMCPMTVRPEKYTHGAELHPSSGAHADLHIHWPRTFSFGGSFFGRE